MSPAEVGSSSGNRPEIDPAVAREIDPNEMGLWWRFCRAIAQTAVLLMFNFKAYGVRHVPRRGGALLCTNHQSYLDPVLFGVLLKRPISFLAKSELFTNRSFGWLIRSLHAYPVRQGKGDKGAIEETIRRLRQGHLLNLYPEGSRTEDGEIAPIQRGVALIVRRAGVPIVPAVVDGSFQSWPKGAKMFKSHPIRVLYGPPMRVEGLKGDQVVELIEATLKKMLADLRAGRINIYR
jgi:1-acyl-sn-glycerol-3-phosphate acyltransferase